MGDILQPGRKEAQKAAAEQREAIAAQKQKEKLRLAEEESEIARRKAVTKSGVAGRSLLTATSPTGVSDSLGG